MKLATIALRNFRSSQNLFLHTEASRVYICGRNGVGKSSIRDAIRWTLRGVCQGTDAKGLGWEALIPEGTTTLSAGVVLSQIGGIERTYRGDGRRTLQLEGRDNDLTSSQQAIYHLLGTTPEYLDAVLETDYFLRLHHADAKAMVLGLLNVQIPVDGELLTLDQVEARYKQAFKDRTDAKTRFRSHTLPQFSAPVEALPPVSEIDALLAVRRRELQGLVGQAGESSGKRAVLSAQLEAVRARGVQTVPERPAPEALRAAEARVAELEGEADRLAKAAQKRPQKAAPPVSDAEMDARIKILEGHRPTKGCVLDTGVPCETHGNVFKNRIKWYRSQMEAVPDVGEDLPPTVFEQATLVEARQTLRQLQEQARLHDQAVAHNTQRQSDHDALTAQLASLKETPQTDQQIEDLRVRIAKGELLLARAREFWTAKTAYDRAAAEHVRLQADVDRLERLVEVLGPNGARVQALAAAIGVFEAAINQVTGRFGWAIAFRLDPWMVTANGRPLLTYSESEQFRIGIAVQMAVAVASGLRFLVVDRLDMLDVENRKAVTQMLFQATTTLEQVFILATREADQALPSMENVIAYRLTTTADGRTVVAETTLAVVA